MKSALALTLEQEFNLNAYKREIETLTEEQKSKYLLDVLRQTMIKNNVIQHLLANGQSLSFST